MVAYLTALGASRTVSLLAIPVAVATGIAPARLSAYRPEGFALGLTLLFVALAMDWMRRRDWRSLLAGALIAALLSQVHGIAAVTAAVLVAAAVLVTLTRASLADQLKRAGIAIAAFGGAVLVTGLVFREASGTVHSGGLVDQGGLADPTWEFYQAARHHQPSVPPTNASMIHDTIQSMYEHAWWWIVPALVLASVGLLARRRDPVVRRLLGFTLLALVGLSAIALVFMLGWDGYVPRRTGASRIVLEASLLVPPFVAIGLAALVAQLPMWVRRWRWPTARVRIVVAIGLVTACALVTSVAVARFDNHEAPSRDELAAWESLPLTSGDIVLSNGYTEGFIPDVTDANGLLDGRAPYTFDESADPGQRPAARSTVVLRRPIGAVAVPRRQRRDVDCARQAQDVRAQHGERLVDARFAGRARAVPRTRAGARLPNRHSVSRCRFRAWWLHALRSSLNVRRRLLGSVGLIGTGVHPVEQHEADDEHHGVHR